MPNAQQRKSDAATSGGGRLISLFRLRAKSPAPLSAASEEREARDKHRRIREKASPFRKKRHTASKRARGHSRSLHQRVPGGYVVTAVVVIVVS